VGLDELAAEWRVLKDRPELHRILLLARLALPESAGFQVAVFDATAFGTDRAIRPTQLGDEIGGYVEVGEVLDGFEKVLRTVFGLAHKVSLLRQAR
jgi:hypothetical protein